MLPPDLLSNLEKVDDGTLWLAVNAALLARYGKDVMTLEGRV